MPHIRNKKTAMANVFIAFAVAVFLTCVSSFILVKIPYDANGNETRSRVAGVCCP
jgi:hypothetical protein